MSHVAIIRHNRVGNISEEVGGEMVKGVVRGVRTDGGLSFTDIRRIEEED